jgi:hypothetical protein
MNIWLLRTEDFQQKSLMKIEGLLNAFEGPLKFSCHRDVITNSIFRQPLIDPKEAMQVLSDFRKSQKMDETDFVCLYTNTRLSNNFFTHGDGFRNFIIHSSDWHLYTNAGNEFPDAYILYSNILKSFVYQNYDTMYQYMHKVESLGCYMDLCIHKNEILIKLRTADICDNCLEHIHSKHIDGRIVGQIFDAFEGLRKQLLFRNRLQLETKLSRIEITTNGKFMLTDYGNIELKFSPLRKAIYKLFLELKQGYTMVDLLNSENELLKLYQSFQPNKTIEELNSTIKGLCNPHSMRIHEEISKINAEIVKKLGERISVNYIISGERGEKRKIKYNLFKENSY